MCFEAKDKVNLLMKKALLISCFGWYEGRLQPIRNLLIQHGYDVVVLLADFDHHRKEPVSIKNNDCTYIRVPFYKNNISLRRIYSHFMFGEKVKSVINDEKPDFIYLLIPPNNVARYCTKYKLTRPQTKLILDIIDLWPESFPLGWIKSIYPARVWKRWRDNCVEKADFIFTECNYYQSRLRLTTSINVETLYLFKNRTENEMKLIMKILNNKITDVGKIKFAYVGSMNHIIDIDQISKTIRVFVEQGYVTELHAIGDGESKSLFENSVEQTGCKCFFYGRIFDEFEKIKILSPCDYAFNMMKNTSEVGLTIKSIDYLSMGLPLLNNIKGDTWDFVERNHIGVNVDDSMDWQRNLKSVISKNEIINYYLRNFTREVFLNTLSKSLKEFL